MISGQPAEAAAVRDSLAAAAAAAEASSRRRTLTSDVTFGSPPALLLGRLTALAFLPHGAAKALDVTLQVPHRMEMTAGVDWAGGTSAQVALEVPSKRAQQLMQPSCCDRGQLLHAGLFAC